MLARKARARPAAVVLIALLAAVGACEAAPDADSGPAPMAELVPRVVAEYPHDPAAFTQGLLWHDGRLYESTGQYGASSLRRVDLETGTVELRHDLPENLFGEGLERVGDRLVQLTWHGQVARVYALDSLELIEELPYTGEGWGLCFDQVDLVRSDGTASLTFHDAGSLAPLKSLQVAVAGMPLPYLNELECIDGLIYANVLEVDSIVEIDPTSGRVTARIDASSLRSAEWGSAAGALNGIAYRPETGTFLITGKNWPKLFEVVFVPRG